RRPRRSRRQAPLLGPPRPAPARAVGAAADRPRSQRGPRGGERGVHGPRPRRGATRRSLRGRDAGTRAPALRSHRRPRSAAAARPTVPPGAPGGPPPPADGRGWAVPLAPPLIAIEEERDATTIAAADPLAVAADLVPFTGGADGLVALTVRDFIGEPTSPLDS